MTPAPEPTVADAMLRHPTVHPADLCVGDARAAFDVSPKTHLLLLVADGVLISTVTRADLEIDVDPTVRAADVGTLEGRTIRSDASVTAVRRDMVHGLRRRLAVVDGSMRLVGLLCLKRSLTGFCTDDGVAAMRSARRTSASAPRTTSSDSGVLSGAAGNPGVEAASVRRRVTDQ